jgi:hypothetical protein
MAVSSTIKNNFTRQNVLLWAANGARLRADKATATKSLRQVFEFKIANTEPFALAAWYGAQIDPALGEELYAKAWARIDGRPRIISEFSIGDLAYYWARLDPAQSRVLVEREWSIRAASFGQTTDELGGLYNRAPTKLVRAMLVIDPARAVEMAIQLEASEANIPDPGGTRQRQRAGWLRALLDDKAAVERGDLEEH